MTEKIPEIVLEELEIVRASGAWNMYDRTGVLSDIQDIKAHDWLSSHKDDYMQALTAMGERRLLN